MPDELRVVGPLGNLGYGVNAESLQRAMQMNPDVIGVDSGSTDCGAYYLGAGEMYHSRKAYKRDLRLLLAAARSGRIPLIIGSAGVAGARPHVAWALEILHEVAREGGHHFKLAVIHSDQDKAYLRAAMVDGRVKAFPGAPPLTDALLDRCGALVAQMGTVPYIEALANGAEVILAGRSCDTAIFAGFCVWKGFDRGLALHMGKILECGAMSAMPPTGRDIIVGVLRRDHFVIVAPNPLRRVTPGSVAGHMVYEVEHPWLQEEPEGTQDFSEVRMAAEGDATRVWGSRFIPRARPTLRFEGAEFRGYRSFLLGGTRDPFLIEQLDKYIDGCSAQVRELEADELDFELDWQVYGRDAVLGAMESVRQAAPHEVGLLVQVLAPMQSRAHDVAALLEARMIGFAYEGARTRTAHIAFPFSPLVCDNGAVYRFGVLHAAELARPEDLLRLFPIQYEQV
ncbi:MAG: acyclic terpene utilization AtuA family protein [Candidatus Rokubacteria bacterium]|nr:acyclic terpene utilization AtuA family protein [Candidatus Rokubacteria bacterium]